MATKQTRKKEAKQQGYLEGQIARTSKLKVDDLLEIYRTYDQLVLEYCFQQVLLPYTRFARDWLVDQARDVYAGTDRNRLIMTARARKQQEALHSAKSPSDKAPWATTTKDKYLSMITKTLSIIDDLPYNETISTEDLKALSFTRLIYDDAGLFVSSLASRYPEHVAEWCSAYTDGNMSAMAEAESRMYPLEGEIGVLRENAWYVFVNTIATYDLVEELISYVCQSYTRLLFRYAHGLRGVTSVEENFSTGFEGLCRAARNYDPLDGSAFTAHSMWWIRSAILQRQRQTSVIALPTTTWYQLSQISKGEGGFSAEKQGQIKERAEMFYAHSQNGMTYDIGEEDTDGDFSSTLIMSPDAHVVLGDGLARAQDVGQMEDDHAFANVLQDIADVCADKCPGLLISLAMWGLRENVDSFLLASAFTSGHTSREAVSRTSVHEEHLKSIKLNVPS